ncbi:hypothetical protein [Spirulina sp. 06S082]|uniref:hypothetical protein n=1 Tax=Spirulina sp. 06S082 TaxID=3110248 RepID=UPI002B1E9B76|nr:hypothetical protein [Spirulina sp. 06S082]MEA5469035.1 hypothetical protein [Spirulina sp. 06S082]
MKVSTPSGLSGGDRVKTLVNTLSFQEKKQLVSELLSTKELEETWDEVFDSQIENYLEAEENLGDIFATLADRISHNVLAIPQVASPLA